MTRMVVPPGFDPFSGRCAALRTKLIALVADRDQLPVNGSIRPDYHRDIAERRADALIAGWEKSPHDPVDEIDRTLASMAQNAAACLLARQAGRDQRAVMVAEKLAPPSPTVTLKVLDSGTGKQVLVTLPRDAVAFPA